MRQIISKISREELEDKYLRQQEQNVVSNISNTRDSVSSYVQTLRRELKIRRAAEYF